MHYGQFQNMAHSETNVWKLIYVTLKINVHCEYITIRKHFNSCDSILGTVLLYSSSQHTYYFTKIYFSKI